MIKHDQDSMKTAVGLLAESMRAFGATLTQVAVQGTRLDHMSEDIRELKHGKGFVVEGPLKAG